MTYPIKLLSLLVLTSLPIKSMWIQTNDNKKTIVNIKKDLPTSALQYLFKSYRRNFGTNTPETPIKLAWPSTDLALFLKATHAINNDISQWNFTDQETTKLLDIALAFKSLDLYTALLGPNIPNKKHQRLLWLPELNKYIAQLLLQINGPSLQEECEQSISKLTTRPCNKKEPEKLSLNWVNNSQTQTYNTIKIEYVRNKYQVNFFTPTGTPILLNYSLNDQFLDRIAVSPDEKHIAILTSYDCNTMHILHFVHENNTILCHGKNMAAIPQQEPFFYFHQRAQNLTFNKNNTLILSEGIPHVRVHDLCGNLLTKFKTTNTLAQFNCNSNAIIQGNKLHHIYDLNDRHVFSTIINNLTIGQYALLKKTCHEKRKQGKVMKIKENSLDHHSLKTMQPNEQKLIVDQLYLKITP